MHNYFLAHVLASFDPLSLFRSQTLIPLSKLLECEENSSPFLRRGINPFVPMLPFAFDGRIIPQN